jgi:hypothetical protein
MKIQAQFCFKNGALGGKDFFEFYEDLVRFLPVGFTKNINTEPWCEKKHPKVIVNAKATDSIIVYDWNSSSFFVGETGSKVRFQSLSISQEAGVLFPSNEHIEQKIRKDEFVSAFLYHSEYVEIQTAQNSNNILHKNFPERVWATIKDTPSRPDEFGGMAYDTRFNPGRKTLISYTWLVAAWKMWFGLPFFELVPRERILSFPNAYQIKELPDGNVFVQLYEKVEDSVSLESMRLQQQWRDWCRYDELIRQYGWSDAK